MNLILTARPTTVTPISVLVLGILPTQYSFNSCESMFAMAAEFPSNAVRNTTKSTIMKFGSRERTIPFSG